MLPDKGYRCSCNAFVFKIMGQPAHGARTIWSYRREQDGVNLVLSQHPGQSPRAAFELFRVGRAHKGVVKFGYRSNLTIRRHTSGAGLM